MRICKVEGCERKHHAKNYCRIHYRRFKTYGDPIHMELERHGMLNTSEYITWSGMKSRCYNRNHNYYQHYGGRGITVCDRWRNSFLSFYEDMGPKPFPEAQLNRIDNDLGYFKENCNWVTPAKNSQNRSSTKLTLQKAEEIKNRYRATDISQKKLASIYGVSRETIRDIVSSKNWKGGCLCLR